MSKKIVPMDKVSEKCRNYIVVGFRSAGLNYLSLLRKFTERYGEEAKDLAKEARYEYTFRSGRKAAERLGSNKIKDLAKIWDEKYGFGLQKIECTDHRLVYRGNLCGAHVEWKNQGVSDEEISEIADLYCVCDEGFIKGFNSKMELELPKKLAKGDPYCEWVITLE